MKFSKSGRFRQSLRVPVPSVSLADSVFKVPDGRHKTKDTIDKGKFIFYSDSKRKFGLPVTRYRSKAGYSPSKISAVPLLGFPTFSQKYSQHSVTRTVVC